MKGTITATVAGIIPARAGFTLETLELRQADGDHPRSRGVYALDHSLNVAVRGSSPLARGLLSAYHPLHAGCGIIPARAGFTALRRLTPPPGRDHPRSRGVYWNGPCRKKRLMGSSPLARGLHLAIGVIPTVGHPTRGRSPSLVT